MARVRSLLLRAQTDFRKTRPAVFLFFCFPTLVEMNFEFIAHPFSLYYYSSQLQYTVTVLLWSLCLCNKKQYKKKKITNRIHSRKKKWVYLLFDVYAHRGCGVYKKETKKPTNRPYTITHALVSTTYSDIDHFFFFLPFRVTGSYFLFFFFNVINSTVIIYIIVLCLYAIYQYELV